MTSQSKPKVIIIGAGIAGLTLSKFLAKNGYPHEVYERDVDQHARYQGWAISVRWYVDKLKSVASPSAPDLESVGILYKTGVDVQYAFYTDGNSDPVLKVGGADKVGLRANRLKLREWLLLEAPVVWDSKFDSYEIGDDGKVTAHFANGHTTTGDILVGADGTMSHVREALYKHNIQAIEPRLNNVHLASIGGEVTLNSEEIKKFHSYASAFVLASTPQARLFVGCKLTEPDLSVGYFYWLVNIIDDGVEDPKHWMYSEDKAMLHEKAKGLIKHINPDFQRWVGLTKTEDILSPLVLRDLLPQVNPDGPVTLLGDAAHAMAPFRGEGGNNAIEDAIELFEEFEKVKDGNWNAAMRAYEKLMVPRAELSVRESHKSAMTFNADFVPKEGVNLKH